MEEWALVFLTLSSSTLAFIKVFSKILWRFSVCPCLWVVRTWPHFVDLQDVNISWNTWGFKDSSVSLWYAVWYILIYHQHPCPSLSTCLSPLCLTALHRKNVAVSPFRLCEGSNNIIMVLLCVWFPDSIGCDGSFGYTNPDLELEPHS